MAKKRNFSYGARKIHGRIPYVVQVPNAERVTIPVANMENTSISFDATLPKDVTTDDLKATLVDGVVEVSPK